MSNSKEKFLLTTEQEQRNYYLKEQKVLEFADEFWQKISGDLTSFFDVSRNILPIRCFNEFEEIYKSVMNEENRYTDYAFECGKNKQAVIRIGINGDSNKLTPSLKRNIQYGLIHYLLWLKDLPAEFNKAEFRVIAAIYDIPTKPKMDEEEQKKFDEFISFYKNALSEFSGTPKYAIWKFMLLEILASENWVETAKTHFKKVKRM